MHKGAFFIIGRIGMGCKVEGWASKYRDVWQIIEMHGKAEGCVAK
jgi:hypothetical protein